MIKDPINLDSISKYASILVPGLSFLLYLIYLIDNPVFESRFKEKILLNFLLNKESILFFVILIISFAIGSYIYLFGLRIYSNIFSKIFPDGMDDRSDIHNYWRHFSISISFTIVLIVITEIMFLLFKSSLVFLFLFIILIISHIMTYLLHKDIKITKKKNEDEQRKSFSWDYGSINKRYYSYEGLIVVIDDQKKKIGQLEKKT